MKKTKRIDQNTIKERDIENILEQLLVRHGWIIQANDRNRNVYHQKPKTREDIAKLKGLEPDFCLYIDKDSVSSEIIIETKKPNMNLSKTKKQALNYAQILNAKIIILFDGIRAKNYWVENQEELLDNGAEVNSIQNANFYRKFIIAENNNYVSDTISINSKEELVNVFSFANQKLRKAGITRGMERFFEFSNLLFLKLISEENEIVSNTIPQYVKWETYKNKSSDELLHYINDTVIPSLENVFNQNGEKTLFTKLIIKDTVALKQVIDKLDKLNLSNIKTDIKGNAFEYFIQQYNSSNNDLGEYFTPRHIVNFLVKLANPQYGEKIYDPFCGTGGILITAFNHIKDNLQQQGYLTEEILKSLKENTVFGSEISSNTRIAKMNMILTGDGHSNVKQQDTLLNPVNEKFDIVITNIPFNLEGTAQNLYSLLSTNGNSQSIQHIINSLIKKPTARAYIIVPESVLNNNELKNLRKYLIDNHLLKQIISLPSGVFLPYTVAKASVLVLQRFNNKPIEKIKYTFIKNDGFTLTQRRRKITDQINDLEEYLFNDTFATREIETNKILEDKSYSFIWFKYFNEIPQGYILLKDILEEEKITNTNLYKTATVTKHDFFGILSGEKYWGDSFVSVTSESNEDYKVVNNKSLAYNPVRANTGSLSVNLTETPLAVSKMYVTFKVINTDFLPEYVYLCLKSNEGLQNIIERSFGSVRQTLRFEDLCTIAIPNIPLNEQQKYVSEIKKDYDNFIKYKNILEQNDIIKKIYRSQY
ncbi:MAG: N-6 DNA methylase [Planctomycetaceae bacterium]|jgi:type I restriction enzyme M protein|nr:N-6 DNA methylase [Planctomycetaceae bacterium]